MSLSTAETSFNKGLAALAEGQNAEALESFREAMKIQQRNLRQPDIRYLSYYGLSLAQTRSSVHAAVEACKLAVDRDPSKPQFLLNLGRVYLIAGKVERAIHCFIRGLRVSPGHGPLLRELRQIDRRSAPVFSRLSRTHPVNCWAGRFRSVVKRCLEP